MSLLARLLNQWLRRVEKPAMARATSADQLRKRFSMYARLSFHAPRGTRMQPLPLGPGALPALEVTPAQQSSDLVLLYFHGGGFVFGTPRDYSALMGQLAHRLGARAVLPDYRLGPENPFPAAFEDACTAWRALLSSGVPAHRIVIGGDSAGGALAMSLLAHLLRENGPLPAAVFCLSPLADMTYSGASITENATREAVLPASGVHEFAQMYLAGHPAEDPRASPLFADFDGAPPVWITAGDTEILRDDARGLAARLTAAGSEVTYLEEHDLPHVWPLFHNYLPEARQTLDTLAHWIRQKQGSPGES